uniref:Uncharacterized protein n=1 Tax=Rhizophora mucronata TaxID=61149 RepID=A0A2P2N2W7_RHIMU
MICHLKQYHQFCLATSAAFCQPEPPSKSAKPHFSVLSVLLYVDHTSLLFY